MYSLMSIAVAGASLLSTVSGAPQFTTTAAGASSTVIPFVNDGFPAPNAAQLQATEVLARGSLPNGSPPPSISQDGITNLQLINLNENSEVAFFADLIHNITTGVVGFEISDAKQKTFVLEVLTAVLAQEELHALNAAGALKHFGHDPILPCKYAFPTTTFDDAIALAATFTDVVLGTLQDVVEIFATNNDNALTRGVASVIGQEGEQEGFFRLLQNKNLIPNSQPFLTTSARDFAFSALQGFVVPGYLHAVNLINLKAFAPLNLVTKITEQKDQLLTFSFDVSTLKDGIIMPGGGSLASYDWSKVSLQLINQQNTPIAEKLQNVQVKGTVVTFQAFFPFVENFLNGLTIGAIAVGGPFPNADAVAAATFFGPALIEVN